VLAAHLAEVIKRNANELLSRHETKRLIDRLSESHPKLADELIPKLMSLGEVQKVLQQLLREQVSIRDLGTILETWSTPRRSTRTPLRWSRQFATRWDEGADRPLLERAGRAEGGHARHAIEEECLRADRICKPEPDDFDSAAGDFGTPRAGWITYELWERDQSAPPVLLCSSPGRYYLRRLLEPFIPKDRCHFSRGDSRFSHDAGAVRLEFSTRCITLLPACARDYRNMWI
jgi:flagellar biosynthesis protein FlhA